MSQVPMIRFPVICPVCLQESIAVHELAPIAEAILRGSPIVLSATCHKDARPCKEPPRCLTTSSCGDCAIWGLCQQLLQLLEIDGLGHVGRKAVGERPRSIFRLAVPC
jgi:hypothetical protein